MDSNFWLEALGRLKSLPFLKTIGISGFMLLFFAGYFAALRHPFFHVRLMPEGPLDRIIGYQPWTIWLYCTLWVYVILPPSLMREPLPLIRFGAVAGVLAAIGLGIFVLWPTTVALQGTGFLKTLDRGGNACPSLHAAFAVFTALCLRRLLRMLGAPRMLLAANWLWCGAILYSTLATKQHVTVDLVAGSILGALVAPFALGVGTTPFSAQAR
jgi:membrane-associated phospholipid phosphatase